MKTPPFSLISSFLTFANSTNMIAAAKLLGVSQPTLTNHLKLFEDYFAQDIFALEGRKKVLTPFGRQLNEALAQRFENLEQDLEHLNREVQKPEDVTFRIAGRSEILTLVADRLSFAGKLVFIPADGNQAVADLLDRDVDLAISNHLTKASSLHAKKLFSNGFSILLAKNSRMKSAHFSKALLQSLLSQPYLAYKENDENLDTLIRHFKFEGQPKISKVIPDWRMIASMANAGHGWAICPDAHIDSRNDRSCPIPKNLVADMSFYAIYRKESIRLKWFKDLLDDLKMSFDS